MTTFRLFPSSVPAHVVQDAGGASRGKPGTPDGGRIQDQAFRRRRNHLYQWQWLNAGGCAEPGCAIVNPLVLQADHPGHKRQAIKDVVMHGSALKRVQAELDRCDRVCGNCHRRRTDRRNDRVRRRRSGVTYPVGPASPTRRFRPNPLLEYARATLGPCVDCGETDPVVLDRDHLDPSTKVDSCANFVRRRDWVGFLREAAKCETVCENCHRIRSAVRGNTFRLFFWQAEITGADPAMLQHWLQTGERWG